MSDGEEEADGHEIRKRSVSIAGHRTSLSLETAFWQALRQISKQRKQSIAEIITEIDATRSTNLSSAVRVFVLRWYQRQIDDGPGGSLR